MKLKLDEASMEDEFFAGAFLIGIVSGLPAYRLCWMINNHFDLDFRCEADMGMQLSIKGNITHLPVYQHVIPNSFYRHLLYKLKVDSASLLPEMSKIDYMWMVQTRRAEEDAIRIAGELKKIPDILLSQIMDRGQFKNLKNLLV